MPEIVHPPMPHIGPREHGFPGLGEGDGGAVRLEAGENPLLRQAGKRKDGVERRIRQRDDLLARLALGQNEAPPLDVEPVPARVENLRSSRPGHHEDLERGGKEGA